MGAVAEQGQLAAPRRGGRSDGAGGERRRVGRGHGQDGRPGCP